MQHTTPPPPAHATNPAANPVTRLKITTCCPPARWPAFVLVHDLTEAQWGKYFKAWLRSGPKQYNAYRLIKYIKAREPQAICTTKEDFDRIAGGKSTPATEAEYRAENPNAPD